MRVQIREFQLTDLTDINKIATQHEFEMPDRKHIITEATMVNSDGIVGYGQVKLIPEAIMVIDKTMPTKIRVECLRQLHEQAIFGAVSSGYDQLHGFITDPAFAAIMQKHYGYDVCRGQALVLNL